MWKLFKYVFQDIENKRSILDITQLLEYLRIMVLIKQMEDSLVGKRYEQKVLLHIEPILF